ncbi:transmembrane protein 26 [Bacillus rossius redtenbacheri]|uniref:transmembrane protein 26 n=1 Tax=Bacillus rossius redtenbacheri TaxID=93214 RepID=UPI002FDDE17A
MAKLVATAKALTTRAVFGAHGVVAIWQVTVFKRNPAFWYLCTPVLLLLFEAVFTLTVKDSQEWKWFCPSVFLYLGSIVPSIWLLELDKLDRRLQARAAPFNISAIRLDDLKGLDELFGVSLKLEVDADTWVTLIEQFLMLVLIVGRWMLPKGDLTRDQLSQLLLVYIGTAADIIEFFDSFKDERVAREPVLVLLTLAIWTWSLLQFTVVLTATKSRKSRLRAARRGRGRARCAECCSIDVWGIALNILLQDAPFLVFRLLLICHYRIISYMNVFFTCKNTLVILLQLYRLYVVYSEARRARRGPARRARRRPAVVAGAEVLARPRRVKDLRMISSLSGERSPRSADDVFSPDEDLDCLELAPAQRRKQRTRPAMPGRRGRQDTGYSTASSSKESPRVFLAFSMTYSSI